MSMLLGGKAVIITGAGRGLGRAYALDAAREGAAVVVNDLDPTTANATAATIIESGGRAVAVPGSTTMPDFGEQLVSACHEAFGRIDGIVANAGVISPRTIFDEDYANAARTLEVNVLGVIETCSAAARAMRAQGDGGSIVLITSGARSGITGMPTYGASKSAVASLCWGWALECVPFGIRVNALSPVARTEMFPQPGDEESDPFPPEGIAPAASYLLSDLSRRITGQIVRFTGDTLALHGAPAILTAHATRPSWTATSIADALDTDLSSGLAAVGAAFELSVPLPE